MVIPDVWKHFLPNFVTVDGIEIDVNEVHLEKAHLSICETDVGMVIVFNDLQREKASLPIDETDVGIVIDVNEEHQIKA